MPSEHKFANDQIFIDKLHLKCTCGPDAFGRAKPQPVLLSVELGVAIARAAASDRVDLSVDYSELSKQVTLFENKRFNSAVELMDQVVELGFRNHGVGRVVVAVDLEKGALAGKKVRWERTALFDGTRWAKIVVEGIEVPVIIGIEENIHERTQKQKVVIDLTWEILADKKVLMAFNVQNALETISTVTSLTPQF